MMVPPNDAYGDGRPSTASFRAALRRATRFRGLMVVVLWQAPVGPVVAPDGSIGLLFGGGFDEFADLSCEGDVLSARQVGYAVAGLELDHDLGSRFRVEAVAGANAAGAEPLAGPFAGVRLRADWSWIGIGAGGARVPQWQQLDDGAAVPSIYLRLGSAEGLHARGDLFAPSAMLPQQVVRIGAGWNATRRDRPSGFIGLGGVGSDEGASGVAVELDVPLSDRFVLAAIGQYAPGHVYTISGFALGGRLLLR